MGPFYRLLCVSFGAALLGATFPVWPAMSAAAAAAAAAMPAHGLVPSEVLKLKQLKQKIVVPGWLPQGFRLKAIDVKLPLKGQKASYQLNYRCFCGGMNYGFAIMGGSTPLAVKQAKRPERQTNLYFGNLEYFFYDPHPPLQIRDKFYLTRPFGQAQAPLRFQVLSNFEGAPMRKEQWSELLKHLRYLP